MFAGLKTLVAAVVIGTFAGAVFGVLVGILADYQTTIELFGIELPGILQWIAIMALTGSGIGVLFGYGFLPDSPADS